MKNALIPKRPAGIPEQMFPCIESHGIIVANLVDKFAMDYFLGEQYIVWFSLIFFKNAKTGDAPEQTEAETGASPEDDTETVSETLPEPEKERRSYAFV